MEVLGTFGGPFGSGMHNAPIPSIGFPADYRSGNLFNILFSQPIAEIEEVCGTSDPLRSPWAANTIAVANSMIKAGEVALYGGLGLQQAWRVITRAQLISIVDAVRTRVLDLALEIERADPSAGQAGAPPLPAEAQQTIVTNIFGGSPNVAVASSDFAQSSQVAVGDQEALRAQLASLGVPMGDIDELLAAIDTDGSVEDELGTATSGWLGRLMMRGRELGIEASGSLIATAIAQFLGIM